MDPASATVSFVSLSITVLNGLICYYQSWSSQEASVCEALQSLTDVQEILKFFHGVLEGLSELQNDTAAVNRVKILQDHLETRVRRLQSILKDCQTSKPPQNAAKRCKVILKRAIYPFKTQTIQELQKNVDNLRATLCLGTDALQM